MRAIDEPRITQVGGKFHVTCACGVSREVALKNTALKILHRGACRVCMPHWRNKVLKNEDIYQNSTGKWCSKCPTCMAEQAYTRKDHARSSSRNNWNCKACIAQNRGFSANRPIGSKKRLFRKFQKSAASRGLRFDLTLDSMFQGYDGRCALSGIHLDLDYSNCTGSLDRIDNSKGYEPSNIQWVHKDLNMMRGALPIERFTELCKLVAKNSP